MKQTLVWCVYYVSDETLAWELDSIWLNELDAHAYMEQIEDEYTEYKVEEWVTR